MADAQHVPAPPPGAVDVETIARQREKGWPDFHPEDFCHRCGGRNAGSWSVDSDRFNAAMAALGLTYTAIVCPSCFVTGHEAATGLTCSWRLEPGTPFSSVTDDGPTAEQYAGRGRT